MLVQPDVNYVTKGGYVVKLDKDLRAPVNMSPGLNSLGSSAANGVSGPSGWCWQNNGKMYGLKSKWNEALEIVEELRIPIPKLPDEYKWKDGYIQYRFPKKGEEYLFNGSATTASCEDEEYIRESSKYFIVEKASKQIFKKVDSFPFAGAGEYKIRRGDTVELDNEARMTKEGKIFSAYGSNQKWTWDSDGGINSAYIFNDPESLDLVEKIEKTILNDDFKVGDWVKCIDFSELPYGSLLYNFLHTNPIFKIDGVTSITVAVDGRFDILVNKSRLQKLTPILFAGSGKYKLANGKVVNLNEKRDCLRSDGIVNKHGQILSWRWNSDGTIGGGELPSEDLFLVEKLEASPIVERDSLAKIEKISSKPHKATAFSIDIEYDKKILEKVMKNFVSTSPTFGAGSFYVPVPHVLESSPMKKETAISVAKVAGNIGWRMANYWAFEPAANIAKPIIRTFRYAVFLTTLCGLGYGYYHPKETMSFVGSFLPSISIEAPAILK